MKLSDFNFFTMNGRCFPFTTTPLAVEIGENVRIRLGNIGHAGVNLLSDHGCYPMVSHVSNQKGIAEGKINLKLKGIDHLHEMVQKLELDSENKTDSQLAGEIADILIEDLSRMDHKNIRLLDVFARKKEKNCGASLEFCRVPLLTKSLCRS
jgi:hypothetical protein